MRPVHPFPARMAPELAIKEISTLKKGGVILDPMVGSGTVIKHGVGLGYKAIGFDMDPLAVLMTKVWTTPIDVKAVETLLKAVLNSAVGRRREDCLLPWVDDDLETSRFINYWFGIKQRRDLRRIASVLYEIDSGRAREKVISACNVLRIALSRIVITKDQGASLGRDISHSRPHKVMDRSTYEVFPAFERSVKQVIKLLSEGGGPSEGVADVRRGDARNLSSINDKSIDIVITSPPYLNAIDYMRGHRLSLVWLGHRVRDLRTIRSNSIGAERAPELNDRGSHALAVREAMVSVEELTQPQGTMVARYAIDLSRMMSEMSRVLKPKGRAVLVVGNSCLKGVFVSNSAGVCVAGEMAGMKLISSVERELPSANRYLPFTANGPLGKRMRTEVVMEFGI